MKSLWQLERDGLTYSALRTWAKNPELFRLSYIEGWTELAFSSAMEWGSCWHFLLEHYDGSDPVAFARKFSKKYERKVWPRDLKAKLPASDRDKMQETFGECEAIFPLYVRQYAADRKLKWIQRETAFKVTHEISPVELNVLLRGKIDGVFKQRHQVVVNENKTKGRIDDEGLVLALPTDFQTLFYAYAAQQITGKVPHRIRYDVVRRPQLRRRNEEGLTDYLDRVGQDVQKRPDWYFIRYETAIDQTDLDNFVARQLNPRLRKFLLWHEGHIQSNGDPWTNPYHELSSDNLFTESTGTGFRSRLFRLLTTGKTTGLYRREAAHPELEL